MRLCSASGKSEVGSGMLGKQDVGAKPDLKNNILRNQILYGHAAFLWIYEVYITLFT